MERHEYTIKEMKQMIAENIVSIKEIKEMFRETDKKFKETAERFKETDKKSQKIDEKSLKTDIKFQQLAQTMISTEKFVNKISADLGGIGNSNGAVAEEFFYNGFDDLMEVAGIKYDYIEPNKARRIGNLQGEYDIVLVNSNKILIVEVKYKLKKNHITEFYNKKLQKFKKLFPEFNDYCIHAGMAALSFESGAKKSVTNKGMLLFTQSGNNIKKISPDDLVLTKF